MKVAIIGCGWVGTYLATRMLAEGHDIRGTRTRPENAEQLRQLGLRADVIDFDRCVPPEGWQGEIFDAVIVSVPIRRADSLDAATTRFTHLVKFLESISFTQLLFFGSVGIYPHISAMISEDTLGDEMLEPRLLRGEQMLRARFPGLTCLRLGGLFGQNRIFARYFEGKVCETGYQTANFVHVEDVYRVVGLLMDRRIQGKTYNVVCPEHPLKKEVIIASANRYGFRLPSSFADGDRTAKVVSSQRLVTDMGYSFVYPSPLLF